jgi:hypothetical protein
VLLSKREERKRKNQPAGVRASRAHSRSVVHKINGNSRDSHLVVHVYSIKQNRGRSRDPTRDGERVDFRALWMTLHPLHHTFTGRSHKTALHFQTKKKKNLNAETRSERRNANDESRVPLLFADVEETEVPTKDAVLMVKPNIVAGFLGYLL